ncbi:MAG: lysophospholipid acyltransferase family protein [Verrucomicrobia bacterium]|nr:lysophospholipid acyltransferase family protein [Verrucomicrobiota bacterium]
MIAARKIRWLERLFVWEVRRVMRRRFYGVYLRGLGQLERAAASPRPLVICTNHSNWWDGFAAALTIPLFSGRRLYLAQSEELLRLYRPLRWLGAFGLDIHGSPVAGVRYALGLLGEPRNAIWIFPQGRLLPQWAPLEVKPGALWLARQSGALVLPVAFRYEWMVESRPSLFIHCGEALEPDASDAALTHALQRLFDAIGPTLFPVDLSGYRPLFEPRRSMNKVWERITRSGPVNPRNE